MPNETPYDALVDELYPEEAAQAQPPAPHPLNDLSNRRTDLKVNMTQAQGANPAARAEAMTLSKSTEIPTPVAERNLPEARRTAAQLNDYDRLIDETPGLAEWLRNPDHAAIGRDDIPNLEASERMVRQVFPGQAKIAPLTEGEILEASDRAARSRAARLWATVEKVRRKAESLPPGERGNAMLELAPMRADIRNAQNLEEVEGILRLEEMHNRQAEEEFIAKPGKIGALEAVKRQFAQNPLTLAPFASGAEGAEQMLDLFKAAQAAEDGVATEEQMDLLVRTARLDAATAQRGTSFFGKVAPGVTAMPAFMGEISLTGGAYTAGRKVAEKAGVAGAEALLRKWLGRALGASAQSAAAMPFRTTETLYRRMAPQGDLATDPEGAVTYKIRPGTGEEFSVALPKAIVDSFAEVASEKAGGLPLFKWLDKGVNKVIFDWWVAKHPGATVKAFQKAVQAGGFHGIAGEMGEEQIGALIRAVGQVAPYRLPTGEELAVQAATFAVFPVAGAALSRLPGGQGQPPADGQIPTTPDTGIKGDRPKEGAPDAKKPAPGPGKPAEAQVGPQEAAAQQTKKFYLDYLKSLDQSATAKLAPEQHQAFVAQALKGTGAETLHIPVEAFTSYFQGAKEDPGEMARAMGAGESFEEAKATGGDLEIPFAEFLKKLRGTGHAEALADDVRFDIETPTARQVEEIKKETAKATQDAAQAAEGQAPDLGQDDEAQIQAGIDRVYQEVAAKLEGAGERKSPAELWGRFFGQAARRFRAAGQVVDPFDMFKRGKLRVFGARGQAHVEGMESLVGEGYQRERFRQLTPGERAAAIYLDPVTGVYNEAGMAAQGQDPARPMVADVEAEGFKFVNDEYTHEAGDDLLRYVAQALREAVPGVARVGGSFRFNVKDQAELDDILKYTQDLLPSHMVLDGKVVSSKGFRLTGRAGESPEAARDLHNEFKMTEEKELRRSERGKMPKGFAQAQGATAAKPGAGPSPVTPAIQEAFKGLSEDEAFRASRKDKATGFWNRQARKIMPKRKYQAHVDLNGLKAANLKYGNEAGDTMIRAFASMVRQVEAERDMDLDATRDGGDEFSAQADDGDGLFDFWLEVSDRLRETVIEFTDKQGNPQAVPGLTLSVGIGGTDGIAEQHLQDAKRESRPDPQGYGRADESLSREGFVDAQTGDLPRRSHIQAGLDGRTVSGSPGRGDEKATAGRDRLALQAWKKSPIGRMRSAGQKLFLPAPEKLTASGSVSKAYDNWKKRFEEFRALGVPVTARDVSGALSPQDMAQSLQEDFKAGELHPHAFLNKIAQETEAKGGTGAGNAADVANTDEMLDYFQDFRGKNRADYSEGMTPEKLGEFGEEWQTLQQSEKEDAGKEKKPRAELKHAVDAGGQRVFNIFLKKSKDASTILHESGHVFRFIMQDLATAPNAPQDLKDDWQAILEWFGVKDPKDITRDHEEIFARGFEQYLRGENVLTRLKRVFRRFRDWLVGEYAEAKDLNVDLSPEIRGVFDRMLASTQEIEQAQHEAGYTDTIPQGVEPDMAKRIQAAQQDVRHQAEEALIHQQMVELSEKRAKEVEKERARVTADAEAAVGAKPLYAAQDALEKTLGGDLAKAAGRMVADKASAAEVKAFEIAAQEYGFPTGAELAGELGRVLANGDRVSEVAARVAEEMAKFKPLMNQEEIRNEAIRAIHAGGMLDLLSLEGEALEGLFAQVDATRGDIAKSNRMKAVQRAHDARQEAQRILSQKVVRWAGDARPYLAAERKAAVKVAKAISKKDWATAAEAKRQQALNHALASEALKNRRAAEKALKSIDRAGDMAADLAKMPYGFARQVRGVLRKFGLGEFPPEDSDVMFVIAQDMLQRGEEPDAIANETGFIFRDGQWIQESLPDFVTRQNETFHGITLPGFIMGEGRQPADLTMAELLSLKTAVKEMVSLGRNYDRYYSEFEKAGLKANGEVLAESIREKVGRPHAEEMKLGHAGTGLMADAMEAMRGMPDSMATWLVNTLSVCRVLDGGAKDGPAQRLIYRLLSEAENTKLRRQEKMRQDVQAILAKHYTPAEFAEKSDKRTILLPDLKRWITPEEALAVGLNLGNDGNIQRLLSGMSERDMETAKDSLTEKDWKFIQEVWDHLETYWPEILALEQKFGREPRQVDPAPVETKFGTLRGGYYPIAYDYNKSADAYLNAEKRTILYKTHSAAASQTDRGHTEARVSQVNRPLRLDLGVLFDHLENVVHDLAFRPAVVDLARFLKQRTVKTALSEAMGPRGVKMFQDWLNAVAADQGDVISPTDRAFRWLRFKTTFATLGYKVANVPLDLASNAMNFLWEAGPRGMARGMRDFYSGPWKGGVPEMKAFVDNLSPRMALRSRLRDRDLADLSRQWRGQESAFKHFGFALQTLADQPLSYGTWMNAYHQAVGDGKDEKTAAHMGDEAVATTFGSGSVLDLVGVQRGPEGVKIMGMYYSWASMMLQRAWVQGKIAGLEYKKGNLGTAIALSAGVVWWAWMAQAVAENVVREFLRNSPPGGDDEEKRKQRILSRLLNQPFGYVFGLREIAPFAIAKATGEKPHGIRMSPVEQTLETLVNGAALAAKGTGAALGFVDEEFTQKDLENFARSASIVMYPQQFNTWVFNALDAIEKDGEATWRDLVTRRTER